MANFEIDEKTILSFIKNYYQSIGAEGPLKRISEIENNKDLLLILDNILFPSVVNYYEECKTTNSLLLQGYLLIPYSIYGKMKDDNSKEVILSHL